MGEVKLMTVSEIMQRNELTKYRLSKNSGIPYTTVSDIVSGKTQLEKCSAETIYKLAKELGVSMESLLAPCFERQQDFSLYKSNVCHKLKILGDIDFIIDTLEKDEIRAYYNQKLYPQCFYLLAMTDYICRENNIPLCDSYSDIRQQKLSSTLYPAGVLAISAVLKNNKEKELALKSSIPEFRHFNIVESEIRNVI